MKLSIGTFVVLTAFNADYAVARIRDLKGKMGMGKE